MEQQISSETTAFLDRFDASTADPTVALDELFCDPFLALDPTSIHVLSPAALGAVLPRRRAMFATAGVTRISRRAATESPVDDAHRLVTVEWTADRGDASPLQLKSSFILRRHDGRLRVVVYLNHADIQSLLAASPSLESGERGSTP
jgi:hypothetical protein